MGIEVTRAGRYNNIMNLVTTEADITPEWLTSVLYANGHLMRGVVTSVETTAFSTLLSSLVRIHVRYSDDATPGAPKSLILKASLSDPKLTLRVGRREVDFYNLVASRMEAPPVPRCYAACYSDDQDRYQLLLEDLSNSHAAHPQSQIPPTDRECRQILKAVAKYQAFWWDHSDLGQTVGMKPSPESIGAYCRWAEREYPRFADFLGDRLSPERRALYEEVLTGLEGALTKRLVGQPNLTLFHGDSHIGNYLFPTVGSVARIIDWQGWGVELGVLDLVSLMAMGWFPERRARLERPYLQQYHTHLIEAGVPASYTIDDCLQDYRLEILRAIFFPISHWNMGLSSDIWWNHCERVTSAALDLHCVELLR